MGSAGSWILLARVLRPQGRKGEVLADLFTSNTAQFTESQRICLAPPGFIDSTPPVAVEPRPAEVRGFWLPVGRNAGRIVLQLDGIDNISAAEALAGCEMVIPASERPGLDGGTVYVADLVGTTVFDGERLIGTIDDVQFPASPDGSRLRDEAAALLVVVSPTEEELLIPFVKEYIREMDLEQKRLQMKLPSGLIDINRGPEAEPEEPPDEAD